MKKTLAILLALVAIGGFVFAEDAAPVSKVGAYLYAGANLYGNKGDQSLGPSWLSSGQFSDLTLSYANGNYGFSGTVEYENAAVNSAFRDYNLWVKPIDMLKLSIGKLRVGDYRLTSYIDGTGFNTRLANAEYGYMVQATPVAGLSLGVFNFIPADATGYNADDQYLLSFDNFNFGASYKIDKVAKFIVAAKRNPSVVNAGSAKTSASAAYYVATGTETSALNIYNVDGTAATLPLTAGGVYYKVTAAKAAVDATQVLTDEYFFGVDVLAVEGLTARLGFTMDLTDNVGGANNNKWNKVWATAGYTVAGVDCGLDAYYKMPAIGGSELYGKVNVAYAIGKVTPSAYFAYTNVDGYVANTTKADGTTALSTADAKKDGSVIGFGGQVKYAVADNATIYLGLDFTKDTTVDTAIDDTATNKLTYNVPLAVEISF